jgi:hypothetical protein
VNKTTEQALGALLILGVSLVALTVIMLRSGYKGKRVEGPVIAAVTAYVFYAAAALIADAKMPEFLREHLFDGLAPAAVVGLLVSSIPREHPRAALPWIRRPVMILVVLFAGGALIFGLIAAAAVFCRRQQWVRTARQDLRIGGRDPVCRRILGSRWRGCRRQRPVVAPGRMVVQKAAKEHSPSRARRSRRSSPRALAGRG